jgi:DNA-binding transcriptional ArsR family regulator
MAELPVHPLTDAELKVLAHPLRVRMLDALAIDGPATASQLAQRFGESSGATSYHLRQLARHEFIEEDEQRSDGRQRWWRILRRGWYGHLFEFQQRDETRAHANVLMHEVTRARLERLHGWFEGYERWDDHWTRAAHDSDSRVRLTAEELEQVSQDLLEVVMRYVDIDRNRDAPDDAALVDIQLYAFPTRLVADERSDGADAPEA